VRKLLLVIALVTGIAGTASAQLTVTGIRNLAFGVVIKGIPKSISPNDPVQSGQFEFTIPIGNRIRLQFTLPATLAGPAGATMPISFGATDGVAVGSAPSSIPVTFDPRVAQTFNIVTSNRIEVFLGGRVTPAANQTTGFYSRTVTLTITVL